ncbi:hypothetical protein BDV96DRAFT_641352 [Lophiotrema nucula]|uniref:Uncharacterized protein n=1 Tax=Lophiotrema nucula TaxID=690887 RepID=A0A6A5ZM25_9PLEO|nr:hypothetical protein BDV96DRAFT_641352 [Lophiotrema nucula]
MTTIDGLPAEILFNILSYCNAFDPRLNRQHVFNGLAIQNRHIRNIVEEYTRVLLAKYTGYKPPKTKKALQAVIHRRKWIRWLSETCWYCKKKTARKALFERSMACCAACDRKHAPKMTMTEAINNGLSKLDLFTPSVLHPSLPPLTHAEHTVMGGTSILILSSDVDARKSYIRSLLGPARADDAAYLRRRIAAHDRIVNHASIYYRAHRRRWIKIAPAEGFEQVGPPSRRVKSMANEDSRQKYVDDGLKKEWAAMGLVGPDGSAAEKPIVLD